MGLGFEKGSFVVYPSHGVGLIKGVETQKIAGTDLKVYVIEFEKDRMTLKIPSTRAGKSGIRQLSSVAQLVQVKKTLKGKSRTKKGMWSKRAKEYEQKINSGNIILLAEVVRDLHKNVDDPDRSYSERIIYENAINRLAGEMATVYEIKHEEAIKDIIDNIVLEKKVKRPEDLIPLKDLEEADEFAEFDDEHKDEDDEEDDLPELDDLDDEDEDEK
jgi:CarD family transcriptional regulator